MKNLKVKDVMTHGVITIPQDASVREAVEILADNDVSGIAITSGNGKLSGVLSETDIVRIFAEDLEIGKDLDKIKVNQIMTTPAITISRDEDLREACKLMCKNNVHRLIIHQEVKRGEETKVFPSGILSISDIVKAIARSGEYDE